MLLPPRRVSRRTAVRTATPVPPTVFASVGNANQDFSRLVEAIDQLAGSREIDPASSFIQTGKSRHTPRFCSWSSVLTPDQFLARLRLADVVVCHGGAGTLIQVLDAKKVPVVMPRRLMYGEHVDDHQIELVSAVADTGRIVVAWEPSDIVDAIGQARMRSVIPARRATQLIWHVGGAIRTYLGEPPVLPAQTPPTSPRESGR